MERPNTHDAFWPTSARALVEYQDSGRDSILAARGWKRRRKADLDERRAATICYR